MAQSSIDLVREAETKAEETARSATRQAAQILDEASSEAINLSNAAEDEARQAAAEKVAAAHEASRQALGKAMEGLDGEMSTLLEKARSRQPEAVKLILDALA